MIRLYRLENCQPCAEIEEKLREMVIAHQIEVVADLAEAQSSQPKIETLPCLLDDGKLYQGEEAVLTQVAALEKIKTQWDRFQSDSCYCGPDGDVL